MTYEVKYQRNFTVRSNNKLQIMVSRIAQSKMHFQSAGKRSHKFKQILDFNKLGYVKHK